MVQTMSQNKWWQVIWYLGNNHNKLVLLHRRIFGYTQKVKGKSYRYDGILEGWKSDQKVIFSRYDKMRNGNYVINDGVFKRVRDVLDFLDVDYRFMPYYPEQNRKVTHH